ncbi:DEAD/DEAH box helicase, partial [Phocaeicola plebeius]
MSIKELQEVYAKHPNVAGLASLRKNKDIKTVYLEGMHSSCASLYASVSVKTMPGIHVFILNDLEEAGYFYHDLVQVDGETDVLFFPSSYRRAIKYGQKDAANEILRTEVLSRLEQKKPVTVVTYPEALAEKVVSRKRLSDAMLTLKVGQQEDTVKLMETLSKYGFEHVDYVYEPGQFALRGSILDVYSFASEYPYRIDFFGDEIDSLRTFEVETQLSKEKKDSICIVPELSGTEGADICFLDFVDKDATLWVKDLLWVRERIQAVHDEAVSPQALKAYEGEQTELMNLSRKLIDGAEFTVRALEFFRVDFGHKALGTPQARLSFETSVQPIFHKNFDLVASSFTDFLQRKYRLYICSDSMKQAERLKDIFKERGDDITFEPVDRTLHEGFVDHALRVCVFTDHQIFDRFHKYNLRSDKARSGKVALSLKELNMFEPGDYVVHIDHGIGRFAGLVRIPNGNTTQEVIKLVYQNEDVVFVSIHSLHKISKYKGKEGEQPRISKLGTGAWEKIKERTKTKIKDIARDLIKLYSQRKQEKGFKYSPDSFLQHELEASFLYEDTPDQLKATQEVKADMESDKPMDRLVCGDVGFGKTEVAIRAAFKAVTDNKQVAVLVPTTVLAYQHFQTFKKRLEDMPCKVEYLSRARTAKDTSRILKELADGKINILIGTHKIIGKSVKFKDLGLLIIDEEQKFGVSVKEKLRQLKVNVDTLTLTATPIPRTLQFSLMGARDLSVIQTPPPNRYPIQTEVHTFNEEIISEAINFEMSRNG